ncbi:MAG TPA: hypothetical protein VN635_13475 [Conexibacter sp.]|nr:hypothetical protein [Conexibacter sp.]
MRLRRVIAPIVLVAAAVLAWRRRRAGAQPSLGAAPVARPVPASTRRAPISSPPAALPAPTAPSPPPAASPAAAAPPDSPFVSVPWTLVAAPEDRAELTIRYAVHPHLELDRADAQETPTQVFVTVLMRPRAAAGEPQAPPQEHEATVSLSGPLGARALIHAPADAAAHDGGGGEPSDAPVYP